MEELGAKQELSPEERLSRNNQLIVDVWGIMRAEITLGVSLVTPEVRTALEAWHAIMKTKYTSVALPNMVSEILQKEYYKLLKIWWWT